MTTKESPFTIIEGPHRNGSTVQIRPGYNGHQRLHVGRRGFICKVTPLHDYAERTTSFLYSVCVGGEEWPYSHSEVEAL